MKTILRPIGTKIEAILYEGKQDNDAVSKFCGHWVLISVLGPYVTTQHRGAIQVNEGEYIVKRVEGDFEVYTKAQYERDHSI